MKVLFKIFATLLILEILFATTACSNFYGADDGSEGSQNISDTPTEILFEASVGDTIYKSATFTNRSGADYTLTNLALVDNVCGAFSVYNITDSAGTVIFDGNTSLELTIAASDTISINILFAPESCEITAYTTTLVIYYSEAGATQTETVSLAASVEDAVVGDDEPVTCEESDIVYYDAYDNPTVRTLPALDTGAYYYLRVDKLSGYLQTLEGFSTYAQRVGTAINLDDIDPANWYEPVYIPLTTDADGGVLISSFDSCLNLRLPAPDTDSFFIGADTIVSLEQDYAGTIDRTDNPGSLNIPDVTFTLHAFINDSHSNLQNDDGYFHIKVALDLTTDTTEENPYLSDAASLTDDDGNPYLNVVGDTLVGTTIRHGTVTLVGVGVFLDDDETKISGVGRSAIIDSESYLFLQIEGVITQAME